MSSTRVRMPRERLERRNATGRLERRCGPDALEHPPVDIQASTVQGSASSDGWNDASGRNLVAVDVVVVAAVGE